MEDSYSLSLTTRIKKKRATKKTPKLVKVEKKTLEENVITKFMGIYSK